jgi:hypothetical protein
MNYVEQLAEDIYVAVHNSPMPESNRLLYLFYAGLALAVGTSATAEQVHDTWCAWASSQQAGHPYVRPFADLSPLVRQRDEPFANAIRAVMARRDATQTPGLGKPDLSAHLGPALEDTPRVSQADGGTPALAHQKSLGGRASRSTAAGLGEGLYRGEPGGAAPD